MRLRTSIIAACAVVLLAAGSAAAQPYGGGYGGPGYGGQPGAYGYQQRPQQAGPQAIVREGIRKLRGFLEQGGGGDPRAAAAFVKREIAPYFDFDFMARWAAGPYWQQLSPQRRDALTGRLAEHFIKTLVRSMGGYGEARVTVHRARPTRRGAEVAVTVATPQRPPMRLAFKFYSTGQGGWKVYDAKAQGQSALVFYRGYFMRNLRGAGQ